jgi:uncharacterized membrane protein YbhN (UPF0104 family)
MHVNIFELRNKKFFKLLLFVITIAIFSFSFYYLVITFNSNWLSIKKSIWQIDICYLVYAFLMLIIAYLGEPLIWKKILFLLGHKLSYIKSFSIFYFSSLAMYLPFKGADLAYRIVLLKKENFSLINGTVSVFYEAWFSFVASSMFAVYFILNFLFLKTNNFNVPLFFLELIAVFFVAVFGIISTKIVYHASESFLKSHLNKINFKLSAQIFILFYFIVLRVFSGIAFYFCLISLAPKISINFFMAISIPNVAWLASLFAFFIPKGIAVREAIIVWALSSFCSLEISMLTALIFRFIILVLDGLAGTLGLLIIGKNKLYMVINKK